MAKKTSKKKVTKKATKKKTAKKSTKAVKKTTKKASKKKTAKKAVKKKTTKKRTSKKKPAKGKKLSQKQLDYFRDLLLIKRAEILGDVDSMEAEALRKSRNESSGNISNMPIHMADIGTDNYEQEFALGLLDSERKILHEIDDALERISEGSYGICEGTGQAIGLPRLEANPWARYCIEYARMVEQGLIEEGETVYNEDEDDDEEDDFFEGDFDDEEDDQDDSDDEDRYYFMDDDDEDDDNDGRMFYE